MYQNNSLTSLLKDNLTCALFLFRSFNTLLSDLHYKVHDTKITFYKLDQAYNAAAQNVKSVSVIFFTKKCIGLLSKPRINT